jgi:hypothetical protein
MCEMKFLAYTDSHVNHKLYLWRQGPDAANGKGASIF